MAVVDVQVSDGDVRRALEALQAAASDARPLMRVFGAYMLATSGDAFKGSTDPVTSSPWPPLAEATLKGKYLGRVRSSYGKNPLRRTGMLMNSIGVLDLQAQTVATGTTVRYAVYHNSGEPRTSKLPQRRFLGFTPEAPDELLEMTRNYLLGSMRG